MTDKQADDIVRDFTESWSVSDEAAKALVEVVTQARRDARKQQAEADALIAESWQYSTTTNPYHYIARAIRRKAGILKNKGAQGEPR